MSYKTKNNPYRPPPDPMAPFYALAARVAQDARCRQGEHEEAEARAGYVTYAGGRQLPPGTRYCRNCKVTLKEAS